MTWAKLVTSLSIKAPADVTLVASVTSAFVSMVSNFVPSTETSRPSTDPVTARLVTDTLPSVALSFGCTEVPANVPWAAVA